MIRDLSRIALALNVLPISGAAILYLATLVTPEWHLWPVVREEEEWILVPMLWITLVGSVMTIAAILRSRDRWSRLAVIAGIGNWVLLLFGFPC